MSLIFVTFSLCKITVKYNHSPVDWPPRMQLAALALDCIKHEYQRNITWNFMQGRAYASLSIVSRLKLYRCINDTVTYEMDGLWPCIKLEIWVIISAHIAINRFVGAGETFIQMYNYASFWTPTITLR